MRVRARETPDAIAFREHVDGAWRATTWGGFFDRAARVAKGLVDAGVAPGDRVAILGPTRPDWGIFDMGAQLVGAVSFGIYPKQTPDQIRYLLEHSKARVVFVSGREELDSVLEAARDLRALAAIVPWEAELANEARDGRIVAPSQFAGDALTATDIDARLAAIDPDATALLVYTSGTTGPPKAAMTSHRNVLAVLAAVDHVFDVNADDHTLCFLPMAHAAERILGFLGRIDTGMPAAYARSFATVLDDVADIKPTIFGSVPRIFEKAYAKIHGEIAKKPPAVQRLFAWAVEVGRRRVRLEMDKLPVPSGLKLECALADRLVFRKIRAGFGGRVRRFVTGAAPTPVEILEFFWAVGLPVFEVYGMTEATVVTHANRPGAAQLGTVGQPIAPMEMRVADDGEILLRGPWIFQGYLNDPEATAAAIVDGWLHTGDIGTIDDRGYLRIVDRKKHLIITSGGKNLAPANIENAIKAHDPLISQVYAHGDRRPYVVAIVAPSPLETLAWGEARGLVDKEEVERLSRELLANPAGRSAALEAALGRIATAPALRERLRDAVRRGNRELAHVEQVRRFAVLERDFGQEHGELTPTMKVKRKDVERNHAALLDQLYSSDGESMSV